MYLNVAVSKYTLPEEITTNIKNVPIQNFSKINEKVFFDFGLVNIFQPEIRKFYDLESFWSNGDDLNFP